MKFQNFILCLLISKKNGQLILWKHIRDLRSKLSTMASQSSDLTLLPKLKEDHVNLTSYSRMCVDLAAEVWLLLIPMNNFVIIE